MLVSCPASQARNLAVATIVARAPLIAVSRDAGLFLVAESA